MSRYGRLSVLGRPSLRKVIAHHVCVQSLQCRTSHCRSAHKLSFDGADDMSNTNIEWARVVERGDMGFVFEIRYLHKHQALSLDIWHAGTSMCELSVLRVSNRLKQNWLSNARKTAENLQLHRKSRISTRIRFEFGSFTYTIEFYAWFWVGSIFSGFNFQIPFVSMKRRPGLETYSFTLSAA